MPFTALFTNTCAIPSPARPITSSSSRSSICAAPGDGFNSAGFVLRAPPSLDNDVFIARIDYRLTADGKHLLFWRGASQDLRNPGAPFLPGDAPQQTTSDHSKGFALGYTTVISPTLTNSFVWGYTRQSFGVIGDTPNNQAWNTFLGMDHGINYSHNFQVGLP